MMPADRATNVIHALYVEQFAAMGFTLDQAEDVMRAPAPAFAAPPTDLDPDTWGLSPEAIAEQDRLQAAISGGGGGAR